MVKVITYILENDATVQGLVGAKSHDDNHKIYPVIVEQTEIAPYVVVKLISRTPAGKNCDYVYGIQIVCYANSYDDVTALNEAVIDALTGQDAATLNGQAFGYANLTGESDDYLKEHKLYLKITTFEGSAE